MELDALDRAEELPHTEMQMTAIQNVKTVASNRLILPFDAACKCDCDSIGSNISHRKTCVFACVLFCIFGFPRHQELPPDEPPQGHICYHFLTLIIQYHSIPSSTMLGGFPQARYAMRRVFERLQAYLIRTAQL